MKCKYIIMILCLVLICFGGQVFAKYILTRNFDVNITTAPFYFEAEMETTNLEVVDNKASFDITLKNYTSDENYNELDTIYEIKLEDESKYSMVVEDMNDGSIIGKNANNNQITINFIPVSNDTIKINEEVTLLINSLSPYKKQISKTINLNKPDAEIAFGSLDDFKQITREEAEQYTANWGTYDELYAGNNEQLEYNSDGSLVFDDDNPILYMELDESESTLFDEEYSMYFTIKADTMQYVNSFGGTIASIGNGSTQYKAWISIFKGYLHIYSYFNGSSKANVDVAKVEDGFLSYDISKYTNQIINIQITATKNGKTNVYINGELQTSFSSGGAEILTTHVTIGDLRPMRNLKFNGTIYDFAMYNKVLTEEEIKNNWQYAKNKWINN